MSKTAIAMPSAIQCPPPVIARDFHYAPADRPRKLSREELDSLREQGRQYQILKTHPTQAGPIIVTQDMSRLPWNVTPGLSLKSELAAVWMPNVVEVGRRKTGDRDIVERMPTVVEEALEG
ncbi:hypothetical protein I350_06915 [Cryptococcus amylolentus CBS 6273]|uniref:Uncharacterized protein n=1 Tax=Cryptococcus amylolentus CBS 6273 TaxID=1296118 RepID=A0A1E3JHI6_9TREE|nr:hypothetical protein I350_06915 [Cryptococcus amylolentus CBS 6273]